MINRRLRRLLEARIFFRGKARIFAKVRGIYKRNNEIAEGRARLLFSEKLRNGVEKKMAARPLKNAKPGRFSACFYFRGELAARESEPFSVHGKRSERILFCVARANLTDRLLVERDGR